MPNLRNHQNMMFFWTSRGQKIAKNSNIKNLVNDFLQTTPKTVQSKFELFWTTGVKVISSFINFEITYFVTLWMISRSFQRPARALSSRWVPVGQSNFLARLIREFVWGEWVVENPTMHPCSAALHFARFCSSR